MQRYIMKRFPFLLFTLCFLQCVFGITDELRRKAEAARQKCKLQVGLTEQEYNDWVNRVTLPTTDGGTCCEVCACWMNELGYMTNGRLNLENMMKVNEQKWTEFYKVEKGNEIDGICTREVKEEGRRECEIALDFRICKTRLIHQEGKPPQPRTLNLN